MPVLRSTLNHWNVGVQIIVVFNLGLSTLTYPHSKFSEGREICNHIFDHHKLARSSTGKVGLPSRVCELSWTPKIMGIVDTKQTLHGPPKSLKVSGPIICTLWHKQVNGHSNIGKAMEWPISHFNELYIRHWMQLWHVTCGPTFSQLWGVR